MTANNTNDPYAEEIDKQGRELIGNIKELPLKTFFYGATLSIASGVVLHSIDTSIAVYSTIPVLFMALTMFLGFKMRDSMLAETKINAPHLFDAPK